MTDKALRSRALFFFFHDDAQVRFAPEPLTHFRLVYWVMEMRYAFPRGPSVGHRGDDVVGKRQQLACECRRMRHMLEYLQAKTNVEPLIRRITKEVSRHGFNAWAAVGRHQID